MNLQVVTAFAAATALAFATAVRADSCDTSSLSTVLTSDDAAQCTSDSGYDLSSLSLPSNDVMALMCSSAACQSALEAVEALGLGDCTVGSLSIESGLIEPIVAYCLASTSTTASTSSESTDLSDDETFDTDSADADTTEFDSAEASSSAVSSSSEGLDEDFDADADSTLGDVSAGSGSLNFQDLVAGDADDVNSASSDSGSSDVDVGDSSSGSDYSVESSGSSTKSASDASESSSSSAASSTSASASSSSSGSNAGSSLAPTSTVVVSAVVTAVVALFV